MRWTAQIYNEQDCYSYDIDVEADNRDAAYVLVDQHTELHPGYYALLPVQAHEQSSSQLAKRIAKSFAGRA